MGKVLEQVRADLDEQVLVKERGKGNDVRQVIIDTCEYIMN